MRVIWFISVFYTCKTAYKILKNEYIKPNKKLTIILYECHFLKTELSSWFLQKDIQTPLWSWEQKMETEQTGQNVACVSFLFNKWQELTRRYRKICFENSLLTVFILCPLPCNSCHLKRSICHWTIIWGTLQFTYKTKYTWATSFVTGTIYFTVCYTETLWNIFVYLWLILKLPQEF